MPVSALLSTDRQGDASLIRLSDFRAAVPSYFFSEAYAGSWRPALRRMVLQRLKAEVDQKATRKRARPLVAIKEPDGSLGADLLMSALPEARLVFLLRDGRDVVDSEVDALGHDGWVRQIAPDFGLEERDRLQFIRRRAVAWVARTEAVQRAYARHPESRRVLVRYEELLLDTGSNLRRAFDLLGLDANESDVEQRVEATRFDRLPANQKGPGKFARSAEPGLWRENLDEEEQAVLETIMGPKLRELNYA